MEYYGLSIIQYMKRYLCVLTRCDLPVEFKWR